MTEIEELEERKKKLLLEREITQLERQKEKKNLEERVKMWGWRWITPLSIIGAILLFSGIFENPFGADNVARLIASALVLIPISLKIWFR